jgi:hypothetical protein
MPAVPLLRRKVDAVAEPETTRTNRRIRKLKSNSTERPGIPDGDFRPFAFSTLKIGRNARAGLIA